MRREKAEGAIEEFQAEIDRMDKEARDDVGIIAKADVSLEDFKLSSDYESLKGQLEMTDLQLDSLFISQIPPENIISSQKVGGKMMFFIRKADGTITTEEIDLPEEAAGDDYSFTIAPFGQTSAQAPQSVHLSLSII